MKAPIVFKSALLFVICITLFGGGYFFYTQTPSGIRRICESASTEQKAEAQLDSFFNSLKLDDKMVYNDSLEDWKQHRRATRRQYYIYQYGSIENAKKALINDTVLSLTPADFTDVKLDDRQSNYTWSPVENYDLHGKQNQIYRECINDRNPSILSDGDKQKYL